LLFLAAPCCSALVPLIMSAAFRLGAGAAMSRHRSSNRARPMYRPNKQQQPMPPRNSRGEPPLRKVAQAAILCATCAPIAKSLQDAPIIPVKVSLCSTALAAKSVLYPRVLAIHQCCFCQTAIAEAQASLYPFHPTKLLRRARQVRRLVLQAKRRVTSNNKKAPPIGGAFFVSQARGLRFKQRPIQPTLL
jgi:hypothetical protein